MAPLCPAAAGHSRTVWQSLSQNRSLSVSKGGSRSAAKGRLLLPWPKRCQVQVSGYSHQQIKFKLFHDYLIK
jgi:hypothetical protein